MITVEKLEKGTYFDDAFKISFRYDPTTVAKVKELAERRYLPEDRAWEIPAHELPALIEKVGLSNIKSEEAVVQALNTKEIEDKREATQERLKGIKPVRDFDFKTAPLPHQIEAFNYGMEKNSLLIGDEQGLGKTKESTMGGFGGYKVIGYKNLDSLNAELNTVMLRRKKEEVLDLPPKLYSTEYVELTTAQKKQYRDIKNGIVADMENILASVNPLNCTLRLRQLTSGNPNLTDDSPKLDRIKEMLEEEIIPNGHKAIIFSQWSTIAKDLGIELSEYDPIVITGEVPPEQRQRLVDNFQTNPHCKVAIGTIGAMGTGLTLNKASYVFFMDKAWNSGDNAQAEDRAHRIGTVGAVNVISMVAKGTIDEAVEDYLLENKDLIDRVVDGKGSKQDIKTILNKLLSI